MAKVKKLDKNMMVPFMNYTNGTLVYDSPRNTGVSFQVEGFGTIDEVELSELQIMKSSAPKFITEPWLVILDDAVVEHLGLTKLYETIVKPEDMDKLFALPTSEFENILKKAPNGMRQLVVSKVNEMLAQEAFDSISKKKIIEEIYKIEFDV